MKFAAACSLAFLASASAFAPASTSSVSPVARSLRVMASSSKSARWIFLVEAVSGFGRMPEAGLGRLGWSMTHLPVVRSMTTTAFGLWKSLN